MRRLLGAIAISLFVLAPWFGRESGWGCLVFSAGEARASLATSALETTSADEATRLAAVVAVLDRGATVVFALAGLAGLALGALPANRWRWLLHLAAFLGSVSVQAVLLAWSIPRSSFGLDVTATNGVVAGVFALPIVAALAAIAPSWRERVVPAAWPALLVSGAILGAWPTSSVGWGARVTGAPFVLALAILGTRMRRRRRFAIAFLGLAPLLLHLVIRAARPAPEGPSEAPPVRQLLHFANRDLRRLRPSELELVRAIFADIHHEKLEREPVPVPETHPDGRHDMEKVPRVIGSLFGDPTPWFAWRHPQRAASLIRFEDATTHIIRREAFARVTVLDAEGSPTMVSHFHVGRLTAILDATIAPITSFGCPILKVWSQPVVGSSQQPCDRYYAIHDDRLALIRSEGYQYLRPPALLRTESGWEQLILASDPALVLEGLIWLGAEHRDDATTLTRSVCMRPAVSRRLIELVASPDPWLREAAERALDKHGRGR